MAPKKSSKKGGATLVRDGSLQGAGLSRAGRVCNLRAHAAAAGGFGGSDRAANEQPPPTCDTLRRLTRAVSAHCVARRQAEGAGGEERRQRRVQRSQVPRCCHALHRCYCGGPDGPHLLFKPQARGADLGSASSSGFPDSTFFVQCLLCVAQPVQQGCGGTWCQCPCVLLGGALAVKAVVGPAAALLSWRLRSPTTHRTRISASPWRPSLRRATPASVSPSSRLATSPEPSRRTPRASQPTRPTRVSRTVSPRCVCPKSLSVRRQSQYHQELRPLFTREP